MRALIDQLAQDRLSDSWIDTSDRVEGRGKADRLARHPLHADAEPREIGLQQAADGHRGSSLHNGPGARLDSEDAPRWSIPPHDASHDLIVSLAITRRLRPRTRRSRQRSVPTNVPRAGAAGAWL